MADDSVLNELEHIKKFQISDLKAAMLLAKANFLVAVGCMNTIEFLGGIDDEQLGKRGRGLVERRFKDGVRLLQGEYVNPNICDEDIMWELRNGLTHQYMASIAKIKIRNISMSIELTSKQAVFRDGENFKLNVAQLVNDLEATWRKVIQQIATDNDKRQRISAILKSLPKLR